METLRKIWAFKQLRQRVIFTVAILLLTRLIVHIPLPGIGVNQLTDFFNRNQIFGMLNMLSGGGLENLSVAMMGVGPYITSSIIMQLLTVVVSRMEALSKEGSQGYYKINQYTRYATVPLALMQAYAMIVLLKSQGAISAVPTGLNLLIMLIAATAGCVLLMWLGELISENGVGNGISLIIALGILGGVPLQVRNTLAILDTQKIISLIGFGAIAILVVAAIVMVTEGERKIPVTYARAVSRIARLGRVDSYLPIKIAIAGVIPIIFAMSVLVFPNMIGQYLTQARSPWLVQIAQVIVNLFQNQIFYGTLYFLLVIGFTFFYTFIVFKPDQVAENLQKQGGFIPGYRPGQETRDYIYRVVLRITLPGAFFLGIVAILPFIVEAATGLKTLVLGGTSVLIMVSVTIETLRQIRSQILAKIYEVY